MRLIKILVVLILAAVIALLGYAYLGDMEPQRREVRDAIPITNGALAPEPATDTDETATPDAQATATDEAPGD